MVKITKENYKQFCDDNFFDEGEILFEKIFESGWPIADAEIIDMSDNNDMEKGELILKFNLKEV